MLKSDSQKELRQTNQMLQELLQASPLATIVLDPEGTVQLWSPGAERIFGWQEKEVLGCVFPAIPDDKLEEFRTTFHNILQGKSILGMETRFMKKEGGPFEVSLWGVPLSDAPGNRKCLILVDDITEKRKMEEEILKVQKLESIGVLAGGVADDFNNVLTSILGNISLAKQSVNLPKNLRIRLDEAEKATLRATHLAQQLLTFTKVGCPLKKMTSIGDLVKESAGFALRGSNVSYEYSLQSDLWAAEIDEGQISQVIHNLVFNARQAMPTGGTLHIKVENILLENEKMTGLKEGPYIRISVRDFGIGMTKENILKVFDPNFTTQQKGNGLRFATACSLVKRNEGVILVESELDKEITLFIYLPAIPAKAIP